MNKMAKFLAFGAVNILIGYAIYPIINKNMVIVDPQKNTKSSTYISAHQDVETTLTTPPSKSLIKVPTIRTQSNLKLVTNAHENKIIEPQANNTIHKEVYDNPDYEALSHWTTLHKEKLFETISTNVPENLADAMINVISENNSFLNSPQLVQDADIDENWAYITEQDLLNLIAQNPLSVDFNLLTLTCKQLTCEVFGSEKTKGIWHKIYWSLLQALPTLKKPDSSNERNSISFSDEGISYIYYKLKFSAEIKSY
jgi:hypothetical protein